MIQKIHLKQKSIKTETTDNCCQSSRFIVSNNEPRTAAAKKQQFPSLLHYDGINTLFLSNFFLGPFSRQERGKSLVGVFRVPAIEYREQFVIEQLKSTLQTSQASKFASETEREF